VNRLKRTVNKFKKVIPALVEGRFLRKTAVFVKVLFVSLDRQIGIFAKYILSCKTAVKGNKVMFISFQGDYTCNPKYITEKLMEKYDHCEIVWSTRAKNLKNHSFPEGVRLVEQYTYDFYKELASSKVWVVNSVEFLKNPLHKKKGQVLIETWHGSLGIKRFDKNANSGRRWVQAATLNGKIADYCISNSTFENAVYRETYWPKTEILEFGHPRNDILVNRDPEQLRELRERIFEKYKIEEGTKVILYAPTFRDSHKFDCYNIDFKRLTETLAERFGGEWKVIVRFHPTVRKEAKKKKKLSKGYVVDMTAYPDIQEIMAISDAAITDYSSWIYDFVLLRRPGFIYAVDIEDYNSERGFYYKLETTPFPVSTNNDELFENILAFDEEAYLDKTEEFLNSKGCFENGTASEKTADLIAEITADK